jgi:hypothetical protein
MALLKSAKIREADNREAAIEENEKRHQKETLETAKTRQH